MSSGASGTVEEVQGVINCLKRVIGTGDTPNAVIATEEGSTDDIVQQFVEAVDGVADELGAKDSGTSGGWFRGLLG